MEYLFLNDADLGDLIMTGNKRAYAHIDNSYGRKTMSCTIGFEYEIIGKEVKTLCISAMTPVKGKIQQILSLILDCWVLPCLPQAGFQPFF